jgi:hypothetical protein
LAASVPVEIGMGSVQTFERPAAAAVPQDPAMVLWERRQALQILVLLPEDAEAALRVLEQAKGFIETYLRPSKTPP